MKTTSTVLIRSGSFEYKSDVKIAFDFASFLPDYEWDKVEDLVTDGVRWKKIPSTIPGHVWNFKSVDMPDWLLEIINDL